MSSRRKQPVPDHEIAIIGAGLSGIGTAIALLGAGFDDVVIYERASDIGGTWRDNIYPGVGVDVPSYAYQFSYALKPDWSRFFAKGQEVKAYIDHCADNYGIRPLLRLDCEVNERVWDESAHLWRLRINGKEATARYVVSAIGAFIDPKPTTIQGIDDFTGQVLRSASWNYSVPLTGKRAAIIGTGASAVQIIPEIVTELAHLDVYQRTPIWVGPKFDPRIPWIVEQVFRRQPLIEDLSRRIVNRLLEFVLIEGVLNRSSARALCNGLRWGLENLWYPAQIRDRELRAKLTPDYDFGCKRPAVSNRYLKVFTRPDVDLVTDRIERITPTGIITVDGCEREVDVLILATGFRVPTDPENYRRTPVRGRDGFDLADFYAEHRAISYEGVALPQLPNHFMIFGPYGWTGGTWHQLVETASAHIVRVLKEARRREATAVEVRPEAARRWTEFAADRMSRSSWQIGNCSTSNSYYFDHHGDTTFIRPTSSKAAKHAASTFPLDDYRYQTHAAV